MKNYVVRSEIKALASQIEALAQSIKDRIDNNQDFLELANELVKSTLTCTFCIGEMHGSENLTFVSSQNSSTNFTPAARKSVNYHNVRDSRGRFVKVVQP